MRVRDHVALSTAGAVLLYPLVGRRVLGAWAGSILIDADHYLWFCIRKSQVNPVAAFRFFNQPSAPHDQETRVLHSPLSISLALLLGARQRKLLPVAIGMAFHTAIDAYHETRMDQSRAAAMQRDNFTCQACGAHGTDVIAHLDRQPHILPSYRAENHITLCPSCHEVAHAGRTQTVWRRGGSLVAMLTGMWKLR